MQLVQAKDFSTKLSHPHKENTAPNQVPKIFKSSARRSRRPPATSSPLSNDGKKIMSVPDVSEMLYGIYLNNSAAKASNQWQQPIAAGTVPTNVNTVNQTVASAVGTNEPPSTIVRVVNSVAGGGGGAAAAATIAPAETASKNLTGDGMMARKFPASFHPLNKIPAYKMPPPPDTNNECNMTKITAIPTSVVVPTTSATSEFSELKPIINPLTGLVITPTPSVIKPVLVPNTAANPQAAAIAAALLRDGYHNFQQQMQVQELMKYHTSKLNKNFKVEDTSATKILENFLRQHRTAESDTDAASDNNNNRDEEDDTRYNGFEDIHLVEGTSKSQFPQLLQNAIASPAPSGSTSNDYYSEESQKYRNIAVLAQAHAQAQAQVLAQAQVQAQAQAQAQSQVQVPAQPTNNMNFQCPNSNNENHASDEEDKETDVKANYKCKICRKRYSWKSTLRRHENVECGGKLPSHACPYCPYKSKQRGNLGVHVRKHHSNLPQLPSKRRSKFSPNNSISKSSVKDEPSGSNTNTSDDSNSKSVMDSSK